MTIDMLVTGSSIYVGSSLISKVYQGNDLIWPNGTPPGPSPAITGNGYYYYYKSLTDEDIDWIADNFDNLKIQGPSSENTNNFSFNAYGDGSASKLCIAIPMPKGLTKVIANSQDITQNFYNNSPKDIVIDGISYRLYYYRALFQSETFFVTSDTSMEYLTLDIVSGGTITWVVGNSTGPQKTIYYSKNNGEWTPITSSYTNAPFFNVDRGDILRFKGDTHGTGDGFSDSGGHSCFMGSTAYFNVYGNIDSLADSVNFAQGVVLNSNYKALFRETNALDASNLYLSTPTVNFHYRFLFRNDYHLFSIPNMSNFTGLSSYCCMGMFVNCTSITKAENLPVASRYILRSFESMFDGCSSLSFVKNLSTYTIPSSYSNWLRGVSETGTFVKASSAAWGTGTSGIPSGWTIIDG